MGFQPCRFTTTGCEVRAVLFDRFGTVVDCRTGVARQAAAFAATHGQDLEAEAFAAEWRALYQPAMQAMRSGSRAFATLDTLHRENLDQVLRSHGSDPDGLDARTLEELNRAWHRLPPWPDSVEGPAAIRGRYIVGPLSNGNTSLERRPGVGRDHWLGHDAHVQAAAGGLPTHRGVPGPRARRGDARGRTQPRPAGSPGGRAGNGVHRAPHRIPARPGG